MKTNNKKYRRNRKPNMSKTETVIARQELPEATTALSAKDLLFKPLGYNINSSDQVIDFDHIRVPFKITDSNVFLLSFMDSCNVSVYIECHKMTSDDSFSNYMDLSESMKQCLEVQEFMGVEYYFGKLNKTLDRYLYALQLFVDKGILDADAAMDLISNFGFDTEKMKSAIQSVNNELQVTRERLAMLRNGAEDRKPAGDMIIEFLTGLLAGADIDDTDE